LVSDFDGVMTNNKIIINEDMAEKAIVTRFDGVGVEILKSMNIEVVILSGEKKGPAFARAKKLKVGHLTSNDKVSSLYRLASEKSLLMNQVAFVGNAENDLGCFRSAGISFAPSDSIPAAQNLADVLLKSRGGEGAIYELANFFRRCNTDSVLK
jgi:YrbI family 3-deoxy-D-manno-octulosonate 8-phosphate phosphatase